MTNFEQQLQELREGGLYTIFEIEVINIETSEIDWIVCDIYANDKEGIFYCQRIGLTKEEKESDKIATSSIDIDPDFSMDWHLEDLMEEIQSDILESTIYTIK